MRGLIAVLLALFVAGPASAAFEDIEVSPRSRAMGSAYLGLAPDAYAPYHNAAALAWTEQISVAASYVRPFGYNFSNQSAASGVGSIGKLGGIGLAFRHFGASYNDESLTGETTVTFAHGFRLLHDLQSTVALGWALNVYSLNYGRSVTGIDPGSATNVGIDLSAQVMLHQRTRVGMYALNINNPRMGKIDKEELIRRVGAGIAYEPYTGVITSLDISSELGKDVQYRGGVEFRVVDFLMLRGGLKTGPNIFTAGVGLNYIGFSLDYGFSTGGGSLDATHQFGITYVVPSRK